MAHSTCCDHPIIPPIQDIVYGQNKKTRYKMNYFFLLVGI